MSMSDYPIWWDTSITIYNRYEDSDHVVTWYKTVIENCFWKEVGANLMIGDTSIDSDSIICRIPKDDRYLPKHEWDSLEDKSGKFTIGKEDIIVRGEVDDNVNEYEVGHRSNDLLDKYKDLQGCLIIDKMTIDIGVGRNNEHYKIIGT